MTTVACNRTHIASDLQITSGNSKFKTKTKIYSYEPHENTYDRPFMVGYTGTVQSAYNILDWLANPDEKVPKGHKDSTFLALTEDGKIFCFNHPKQWIEIDGPYYAVGSGCDFALATLSKGGTPKEAIEVAMKHDIHTGMGVQEFSFEE